MKYTLTSLFLFFSTLFSVNAFAIFCPTNFSQINFGDTIQQVIAQCGQPESQNTSQKTKNLSEDWVYYVRTEPLSQATSKMSVVFANDKVVNISLDSSNVNVQPDGNVYPPKGNRPLLNLTYGNKEVPAPVNVSTTTACGSPISIGDTRQRVESVCGNPVSVTQNQAPESMSQPTEVTELKYGGMTPATLIFENGILKSRQ